jgi:peptidoglycan hydrolase FlgJ
MTQIQPAGPASTTVAGGQTAALQKTARQLEGVFVDQLFKAMRETVPHDGYLDGGSGEDMFTSMLDEKVADQAPAQWNDPLAAAIVRQLQTRRPAAAAAAAARVPDAPAATLDPAPRS